MMGFRETVTRMLSSIQRQAASEEASANFPSLGGTWQNNQAADHGLTHTRGKDVFIVDLDLDPVHEKVHVLGGRQGSRLLVLEVILPPVFVLGAPWHHRAGPLGAELTDGAVDEVDAIEEVHHVHRYPVVLVLPAGQLHSCLQVHARAEGGLSPFVEFEPLRARFKFPLWPEGLVLVEHLLQGYGHVCSFSPFLRQEGERPLGLFSERAQPNRGFCCQPSGPSLAVRSSQSLLDSPFHLPLEWFPGELHVSS